MTGHGGIFQPAITLVHQANYYPEALEHMPQLEAVSPMSGPGDMVLEGRGLLIYCESMWFEWCTAAFRNRRSKASMESEIAVYLARS